MKSSEKKYHKAMEIAAARFNAIAPAVESGLSPEEIHAAVRGIAERSKISERTVYRWLEKYRKGQFPALMPYLRMATENICRSIEPLILERALALKIELPTRSVPRIILALQSSGIITEKTKVAQSTLRRYLQRMKHTWQAPKKIRGIGSRSFCMDDCNKIWQSDIKEVREIKFGVPGKPWIRRHVYFVAYLDDKSRLLCHGEWYFRQKSGEVLDCFRKAIEKYGLPHNVYTDNGSQYTSGRFGTACAQLGIRHRKAGPYRPESKGKVERMNRTVEEFIQEMRLEQPKSIEELNKHFRDWMDDYNNREHSSLDGYSPNAVFNLDKSPKRRIEINALRDSFKTVDWRLVSKNGCAKVNGKEYDVGNEYIGSRLQFRYEEPDVRSIELWDNDVFTKNVYPLVIQEKNSNYSKKSDKDKPLQQQQPPVPSLVAQGWNKNRNERLEKKYGSLSFQSLATDKEDNNHAV